MDEKRGLSSEMDRWPSGATIPGLDRDETMPFMRAMAEEIPGFSEAMAEQHQLSLPLRRGESGRKPTLSWALIVRNDADRLAACLESLRERTPDAEIVVVDTCSSDGGKTLRVAETYADRVVVYKGPRGDWSPEMPAFDDASAARNYAMSLCTGKWTGWVDSVTGDTPVAVRRTGSEFFEYVEIRDLVCSSEREVKTLQYEKSAFEVLTHDGWQRIRMIKQHKVKKPVYRIVDDGDVRVTRDHSLMRNGQPILGCDVRAGTKGSSGTILDHVDPTLTFGLQVATIREELAEAWGFFAAEGWAGPCSSDTRWLWAATNTDKELLNRYKTILEAAHCRPFRIVSNGPVTSERHAAVFRLEPQDPNDLAKLYRAKFYSSGARQRVPSEILNGTPEIRAAFLSGYEAGDGHVRRMSAEGNELQAFSTNSPLLAAGLVYLYRSLGRSFYCNAPRPDKPGIVSCVERMGNGKRKTQGVRHLVEDLEFAGWVYDLNTEAGTFVGGVGDFILHNSDDILPGPQEAERLLRENGRWQPNPELAKAIIPGVPSYSPIGLEEAIRSIDHRFPDIKAIWCPYLYRRHKDGTAAEWQYRERFVRNDGSFHWVGKGHEVLVAKHPDHSGKIGHLSSLLFVHTKDWGEGDYRHSLLRHYEALIKEYEEGTRDFRTCFYLENFSRVLCPWRRGEFLKSAYECAYTKLDRSRILQRLAAYAAENGFFLDMVEAVSGAAQLTPHLPDPWILGAELLFQAKDHEEACRWYSQGLRTAFSPVESLLNPRDLLIGYKMRAATCLRKLARIHTDNARYEAGIKAAEEAFEYASQVFDCEAVGPDKEAVQVMKNCLENELGSYRIALQLNGIVDYLKRNDEPAKALELLSTLLPHTLEDHPLMGYLRDQLRALKTHLGDKEAYAQFYLTSNVASPEVTFDAQRKLPRTIFALAQIAKLYTNEAPIRILEIGCFDGLMAFPLLEAFPNCEYVGVDLDKSALQRLEARATPEQRRRITTVHGYNLDLTGLRSAKFDVLILMEVLEHAAHPRSLITAARALLRPTGQFFVSTPWGSFDQGRRLDLSTPDPRGHVRALTPREIWELLTTYGQFRVAEMGGGNAFSGATVHALVEPRPSLDVRPTPALTFCVAAALWDWNASEVYATGIGASEETIVYLARELARDQAVQVEVFGPVPYEAKACEEVRDRVAYWTRQKVGKIDPRGPVIVSRAPQYGQVLLDATHEELDMILWLQDTHYPDLSEETARLYRSIVTVSNWHQQLMRKACGKYGERATVIPNFLLPEHFSAKDQPRREPHHFVYANSPDRGLIRLLKLWPAIRALYPDATLDVFYGWEGCMTLGANSGSAWNKTYRAVRTEFMGLQHQPGLNHRGRVDHQTLAREFQRSSAWLYPTHFAETCCLTAAKAMAGGCVPVTTFYAGLRETAASPHTSWVDMPAVGLYEDPTGAPESFEAYQASFLAGVQKAVETTDREREAMSVQAISDFGLYPGSRIDKLWRDLLDL